MQCIDDDNDNDDKNDGAVQWWLSIKLDGDAHVAVYGNCNGPLAPQADHDDDHDDHDHHDETLMLLYCGHCYIAGQRKA